MKRNDQIRHLNLLLTVTGSELLLVLGFATGLLLYSKNLSLTLPNSIMCIFILNTIAFSLVTLGLLVQASYFRAWYNDNSLLPPGKLNTMFFYLNIPVLHIFILPLMVLKPAYKTSRQFFLLMVGVILLNLWGIIGLFKDPPMVSVGNYLGCMLATQVAVSVFALRLTGLKLISEVKYLCIAGAVMVFIYIGVAWQAMILAERKAIELDNRLNVLGVPSSREEVRDNYYSGFKANDEFTKFVRNLPQSIVDLANYENKEQLSQLVNEAKAETIKLDKWFSNPVSLRLKRNYKIPLAYQIFPEVEVMITIQHSYAARIDYAIKLSDRVEALRLFRLMNNTILLLSEADAMLLSPACAVKCGEIQLVALDKLLQSKLLTFQDQKQLARHFSGAKRFYQRIFETGWQLFLFAFRDVGDAYIRTMGCFSTDRRNKLSPLRSFTGALHYVMLLRDRNRCIKQFLHYSWQTHPDKWPRTNPYQCSYDIFKMKFSKQKVDIFFNNLDLMKKKLSCHEVNE